MSDYYVSSVNGDNANDGSSKANAKADIDNGSNGLLDAVTLSAGDVIYIDSAHSETWNASKTLTFSNGTQAAPILIYSIDWSTEEYEQATSAQFTVTGVGSDLEIEGEACLFGLYFSVSDNFNMDPGTAVTLYYYQCTISTGGMYHYYAAESLQVFEECDFIFSDASTPWTTVTSSIRCNACTFRADNLDSSDHLLGLGSGSDGCMLEFCNCDFTVNGMLLETIVTGGAVGNRCIIKNCTIPAGCIPADADFLDNFSEALMVGCHSGSASTPQNYQFDYRRETGVVTSNTNTKRTGGATDGQTSFSWKVEPASVVHANHGLLLPPIRLWVAPGTQTITLYLTCGSTLTDANCWLELSWPDEATPSYAEGEWYSSRANPLATGTNLTSDGDSSWTNGLANKYKIEKEISPAEAGLVEARLCFAADYDLYVDPVLYSST